jgi:hypothetical protein
MRSIIQRLCFCCATYICVTVGYTQETPSSSGASVIDGSKTPELIPDSTAFRLVLVGLAEPPNPTSAQAARQRRKLSQFVATESDRQIFSFLLANFYAQYAALRDQYRSTRGLNNTNPFAPLRDALVSNTTSQLANLVSPDAAARFRLFVQDAKRRMLITRTGK